MITRGTISPAPVPGSGGVNREPRGKKYEGKKGEGEVMRGRPVEETKEREREKCIEKRERQKL